MAQAPRICIPLQALGNKTVTSLATLPDVSFPLASTRVLGNMKSPKPVVYEILAKL